MSYAETLVYSRLDLSSGQHVDLLCNTSLSPDIMWTYDIGDGHVDYVYWSGHVASNKTWLSVKSTVDHYHSLVIDDAAVKHSGLYVCYDGEGQRKVGYKLVIAGMNSKFFDAVANCCSNAYMCNDLQRKLKYNLQ